MLATPKRPRPTVKRPDSISEALAAIDRATVNLRSIRLSNAAAKPARQLHLADLQAVVDQCMREYFPQHPRVVVTAKEWGMFRKNVEKYDIKDFPGFVRWALTSWANIAARNQASYRKDPSKFGGRGPIPSSFDFGALAYRFPYFAKIYAEHLSGVNTIATVETEEAKQIRKLKEQVRQLQQENAAKDATIKRIVRRPQSQEAAARPAPARVPARMDEDAWQRELELSKAIVAPTRKRMIR